MAELESEKEEVGGLVMIRVQGRKEVEKGQIREGKVKNNRLIEVGRRRQRGYGSLPTIKSHELQMQRCHIMSCKGY